MVAWQSPKKKTGNYFRTEVDPCKTDLVEEPEKGQDKGDNHGCEDQYQNRDHDAQKAIEDLSAQG